MVFPWRMSNSPAELGSVIRRQALGGQWIYPLLGNRATKLMTTEGKVFV